MEYKHLQSLNEAVRRVVSGESIEQLNEAKAGDVEFTYPIKGAATAFSNLLVIGGVQNVIQKGKTVIFNITDFNKANKMGKKTITDLVQTAKSNNAKIKSHGFTIESVGLNEAWDAEAIKRNAKTGYGINMKGGKFSGKKPPKTPYDYMKIKPSKGNKFNVQLGLGKKKKVITGTAEEMANEINKLFGFNESVELDERTTGPTRIAVDKEFNKIDSLATTRYAIKHVEKMFKIKNVKVQKDKNGKTHVISFKESVELGEKLKSIHDVSLTSKQWRKAKHYKTGKTIEIHPFDDDRFVTKSPKGGMEFIRKSSVKESVELDEVGRDRYGEKGDSPSGMRISKGRQDYLKSPEGKASLKKRKEMDARITGSSKDKNGKKYILSFKESIELDEDNTAAVAKQVKQAVKKYTTGKLAVQSKGGKSRFIMVRADKIDNKLRKMILVTQGTPISNVKNQNDIHYGNISDRIISAGVEVWIEALGLKESVEMDEVTTMKMIFKFPTDRNAKDFAYDISNAAVATGEVVGNKVSVEHPLTDRNAHKAISKYMKKNRGELLKENLDERKMTKPEVEKKEEILKALKRTKSNFNRLYGDEAKNVMYATATKNAMKDHVEESAKDKTSFYKAKDSQMDYKQLQALNEAIQRVVLGESPTGPTRQAVEKEFMKMTRSGKMDQRSAIKHVQKMFKIKNVKLQKDKNGKTYVISFNESVQEGLLDEGKSVRDFDVPPSPEAKKHILQTKPSEFLWSADSVLGGDSKFVVIPIKRGKSSDADSVMMAIISNPDSGKRKIFSYMGTHRNVKLAQKFAKNNKLVK